VSLKETLSEMLSRYFLKAEVPASKTPTGLPSVRKLKFAARFPLSGHKADSIRWADRFAMKPAELCPVELW